MDALYLIFFIFTASIPASYIAFLVSDNNYFHIHHEKGLEVFLRISVTIIGMILLFMLIIVYTAYSSSKDLKQFFELPILIFILLFFLVITWISFAFTYRMKLYLEFLRYKNSDEWEPAMQEVFNTAKKNKSLYLNIAVVYIFLQIVGIFYWYLIFIRFVCNLVFHITWNLIRYRKFSLPVKEQKQPDKPTEAKPEAETKAQDSKSVKDILDKLDKF